MVVDIECTPLRTSVSCDGIDINYVTSVSFQHYAGEKPVCDIRVYLPTAKIKSNGYLYIEDPFRYSSEELVALRNAINDEITKREL